MAAKLTDMENEIKEYKVTARSTCSAVVEPFVDFFEVSNAQEAVDAWKAQAAECGVELSDIQLVKLEVRLNGKWVDTTFASEGRPILGNS